MKKIISFRWWFFVVIIICNIQCQKQYQPGITKAAGMANSTAITSTIIYTNVNPDSTIVSYAPTGEIQRFYNLDLNNDGKADFVLWTVFDNVSRGCSKGGFLSHVSINLPYGSSNQFAVTANLWALALDSLTTIGASLSKWSGATIELGQQDYVCNCVGGGCSGNPTGPWVPGTTKYLGLKLISGSNIYYGWARLMIETYRESELIVMDYAYNSSPNQPILAGQKK
jgi:hypothetical protein